MAPRRFPDSLGGVSDAGEAAPDRLPQAKGRGVSENRCTYYINRGRPSSGKRARRGAPAGKPIIRGTRIAVHRILDLLAAGETTETILRDYYSHLAPEEIQACLEYAAKLSANEFYIDLWTRRRDENHLICSE